MAELSEFDGVPVDTLARELGVARVSAHTTVGSTMDVANDLGASGAADPTLVVAYVQTEGRGRGRREWHSPPGGVWLTLLLRPTRAVSLDVLPLRAGMALASALDEFAAESIGLKWPNDLYVGERKLAGVLAEARWREQRPEWLTIGVGINLQENPEIGAAGLRAGTARIGVLRRTVPALLAAARAEGDLTPAELTEFAGRDIARGREIVEPVQGTVRGIAPSGALLVEVAGAIREVRAGSIVFASPPRPAVSPQLSAHSS